MPTRFPHPFQCDYYPLFETKNDAAAFIEDYQANGHMKKCAHLAIRRSGDGYSAYKFGPSCDEDSFHREDNGRRSSWFIGCPVDCRMYQPAWKRTTGQFLKRHWRPIRENTIGVAQWFASLPWFSQLFILIIALALLGIPYRGTLYMLVKLLSPLAGK